MSVVLKGAIISSLGCTGWIFICCWWTQWIRFDCSLQNLCLRIFPLHWSGKSACWSSHKTPPPQNHIACCVLLTRVIILHLSQHEIISPCYWSTINPPYASQKFTTSFSSPLHQTQGSTTQVLQPLACSMLYEIHKALCALLHMQVYFDF